MRNGLKMASYMKNNLSYCLQTFDDAQIFWARIQSDFTDLQKNVLSRSTAQVPGNHSPPFYLAASGGSASRFFEKIHFSPQLLTRVFLVDERFVPPEHPYSNAGLLQRLIIENKHSQLVLQSWHTEQYSDRAQCARDYALQLPTQFHLTLLGVGPDGHTASLFPQGKWLEQEEDCVLSQTENFDTRERLGFSFQRIARSEHIWILMMGHNKKEILQKISHIDTDFHDYPARKALTMGCRIYFLNQ